MKPVTACAVGVVVCVLAWTCLTIGENTKTTVADTIFAPFVHPDSPGMAVMVLKRHDRAKWDRALREHTLLSEEEMKPALTP
jgi:hypothetical protein